MTNVQVGQALYWPTEGRFNAIAALPTYLVGADFILTNVSDAHENGKEPFITFRAGTDLDVYVMKNKDSAASFPGWTLVESNYPVEPGHYFRGGAEIYRLSVVAGGTVSIPYSAIRGEGGGNLVFAQKAASAAVWITSPMPGEELAPVARERFAYVCQTGQVVGQQWWVRYGGGEWESLGSAADGELGLPYTDTRLEMELRLDAQVIPVGTVGPVAVQKVGRYQIVNKAAVTLVNPGPGSELLPGEVAPLMYAAQGMAGQSVASSALSWQDSRDGVSWVPAPVDGGGGLTVPAQRGAYWLKAILKLGASADSGSPESKEFVWRFAIVDAYSAVSIEMGQGAGECADGSEVGMHASGKVYGFVPEHTDQIGSFLAFYHPAQPRWGHLKYDDGHASMESYIALLRGGYFQYDSGNGRYKVTVYVAPAERHDRETLKVNGASVAIRGGRGGPSMMRAVLETTVSDGKLVVGGSEGLPLMRVEIERLGPGAPVVSTSVTHVSDVEIWAVHEGRGEDHDGRR